MIQQGLITVKDCAGGMATIVLEYCRSLDAVKSFADFVQEYTDAEVFSYSFNVVHAYSTRPPHEGGAYDRVNTLVQTAFISDDGTGIFPVIPAPKEKCVDVDQEPTKEFIAALETALLNATSFTQLFYRHGGLTSKVMPNVSIETDAS